MSEKYDLLILGGTLLTPNGAETADVGVREGKIAAIGSLSGADAPEKIDAAGLHVLPGVIDTQVHFREPGLEHKEDLETGTRGAAKGGVTAIFEMPNTSPSTTTAEALAEKVARGKGRAWCDYAFFMGASSENAEQLGELERVPGCSGVKIFMGSSTGGLLVEDDEVLLRVLSHGTRRVAIHSEDEPRLRERAHLAREGAHPKFHPVWRDEETAIRSTKRLLALARQAKRRAHVLHVTTREEVPLLAANKDLVTMEVTPQHLTLIAPDCYEKLGTRAQMNPPIRGAEHQAALWEAIRLGIVDVIGSDHAPHLLEEKNKDYPKSPAGMPGVQTLVPIMLNHVNAGRLTLRRFVDLTSAGPARIYNIAGKGRTAVGFDADFTLVDLKARGTITDGWMESRCGWTPFDGMEVTGWPTATIIRGNVVMRDDELLGSALGTPVRFSECL
ncbi:MAG: dihydroorotase [Chrysiogenetes bacterium]|nr:dihydroorotase [Chrysiogenetes bacterium]